MFTLRTPRAGRFVLSGLAVAGLLFAQPVLAQDSGYHVTDTQKATTDTQKAQDNSGYQVGESHPAQPARPKDADNRRLARVEYVSGKVTWRPNDTAKWDKVGANHPLKEGAQLWAEDGARAEIRFDDGSILRMGSNAVVTLQTVYVDAESEYTQIKMVSGVATLLPREERSLFEFNTPSVSIKTAGPSRLRVGVGDTTEVGVSKGIANLDGAQGKITLDAGDFISVRASDAKYVVRNLPAPDSWEQFNWERDRKLAAEAAPPVHHAASRTYTSVFLSLGFPVYVGPGYRYYGGRHRW